MYQVATHTASPFYSTYLIGELGLSLKNVTALGIVGSISRIAVSRLWGKFADKHSFAKMFGRASAVLALAFLTMVFTTPKNATVLLIFYYVLHGIALGGTNSGLINLVFDYAPSELRADSLAICQAIAGAIGFLSTLAVSPVVSIIQNSNSPVYAQQILSVVAMLFGLLIVLFVNKTFKSK